MEENQDNENFILKIIQDLFILRFILYMEENQNNENFILKNK